MKVSREDFLTALEAVRPALSRREAIEQSSTFAFEGGKVLTFNGEMFCSAASPLGEFSGAVQAVPLLEVLRGIPDDEVDVTKKNGYLMIGGRNKQVGVRRENEVRLPTDKVDKPGAWRPLPADVREAVGVACECVGKDASRFVLVCVHFGPHFVEATDKRHYVRYKVETGFKENLLLRGESVKHAALLEMTEVAETAAWVFFRNQSKHVMACRRYTEAYGDRSPILKEHGKPATLPKRLAEAAEKAEIFSKEKGEEDNQVTVTLRPGDRPERGVVQVRGEGQSGYYAEVGRVTYTGRPMRFVISPGLLARLVRNYEDCEVSDRFLRVDGSNFSYFAGLTLDTGKKGGGE